MRCITKERRSFYPLLTAIATLMLLLGPFPSYADSAEEEMRTKQGSSRKTTDALACDSARNSAMNRAKLDCGTSGGIMSSAKFAGCKCNRMGGKPLCSVTITYECN